MSRQVHRGDRKPFGFWRSPEVLQVLADFDAGRIQRDEAYRRLEITHYGEPKATETLNWYVSKYLRNKQYLDRLQGIGGSGKGAVDRVTLGEGGRVVIPVSFRHALSLREGDEVIMRLEEGELRIVIPFHALKRAQALVREHVPTDRSLTDELIAERRREASGD